MLGVFFFFGKVLLSTRCGGRGGGNGISGIAYSELGWEEGRVTGACAREDTFSSELQSGWGLSWPRASMSGLFVPILVLYHPWK